MAKVSSELFRRLTWYRRYEAFRGSGLGFFRDVREMLLVMEAAGTFKRLPKRVFEEVIDAELHWLEIVFGGSDSERIPPPEGFSSEEDPAIWKARRQRERASYAPPVPSMDAELSHRATDYQSYMGLTGDTSVLRDNNELILVAETAGTMKRLPVLVRNAFYQAELLWDPASENRRPRALQFDYSNYANPYLTEAERST